MAEVDREDTLEGWPELPLTSPVCPSCGRKELPRVVRREGAEHVIYECRRCNRRWTVRHQDPAELGTPNTRRH